MPLGKKRYQSAQLWIDIGWYISLTMAASTRITRWTLDGYPREL